MLTKMRRHITKTQTYELLQRFRDEVPDIHLRTTLLLGHPGETEADVEELKTFVRDARFERLGAFAYSDEDGTFANRHYVDDIPFEVKQARVDEIMSIQEHIAGEINAAKVGRELRIVIDRREGDYFVGRTEYDSPEVDGEVLLSAAENPQAQIGQFYTAKIDSADTFDLFAHLL